MTKQQKMEILKKRALKTIKKLKCNGSYAYDIARKYAQYIEQTPMNARCMGFDERLSKTF